LLYRSKPAAASLLLWAHAGTDRRTDTGSVLLSGESVEYKLYGVKSVLPDVPAGGVASVEQMERQLPRTAKDHFCKSCKSDEILEG